MDKIKYRITFEPENSVFNNVFVLCLNKHPISKYCCNNIENSFKYYYDKKGSPFTIVLSDFSNRLKFKTEFEYQMELVRIFKGYFFVNHDLYDDKIEIKLQEITLPKNIQIKKNYENNVWVYKMYYKYPNKIAQIDLFSLRHFYNENVNLEQLIRI